MSLPDSSVHATTRSSNVHNLRFILSMFCKLKRKKVKVLPQDSTQFSRLFPLEASPWWRTVTTWKVVVIILNSIELHYNLDLGSKKKSWTVHI